MKKMLFSAALAATLTFTLAAASIAAADDPGALPDASQKFKCAVYKGDPGIRKHTPAQVAGRECETYWANDTVEDEREMEQLRRVASAASGSRP